MAQSLIREADDLLYDAEQDAAADLLDTDGIQSLRSLHQVCWRAVEHRRDSLGVQGSARLQTALPANEAPSPPEPTMAEAPPVVRS